jgi:hypothetical protein
MTNELIGSSVDITHETIHLTVERSDLYDYTLIDMPGLVYSPSEGQSEDIDKKIRNLVLDHIKQGPDGIGAGNSEPQHYKVFARKPLQGKFRRLSPCGHGQNRHQSIAY